jgi:hypothetical protein
VARTQKLKVFRTPIGFHDAYVAAPSQKAALEAWGSDTNLFASGAAERIDDPELMREPLADPGKVIRRLRGTVAEHMAALPKDKARSRKKSKGRSTETSAPQSRKAKPAIRKPPPKPKPRPNRQPLTRIEAELAEIEKRHERERSALGRKQAELDRERRALERDQAREHDSVERRVAAAREKYDRAMRAWRAD